MHVFSVQAGVYRQVIDSVIQNSRADFEEMGFEDSVLSALQKVSFPFFYFCLGVRSL